MSKRRLIAGLILVMAMIASGFTGAWLQDRSQKQAIIGGELSGQKKIVTSESRLISQIAKTIGPSVVSINAAITDQASASITGPFGFSGPQQVGAAGTGVIISSGGIVVTNRHVVPEGTTQVTVTLSDGTELKDVSVIGRTNNSDTLDIAFLKINNTEGKKLQAAAIGNSSSLQVGENVIAIGNALGEFQNTVTSGIVSGFGRNVVAGDRSGSAASTESLTDLIQTDAAINEGNSGGPLVNLNGQVIGINTAVAGGSAQNIGFAIPINNLRGLIKHVIKTGEFARPYLGVRYVSLTTETAKRHKLTVSQGAYILITSPSQAQGGSSVIAGSPAEKAGLKEGDIITTVNDTKIDSTRSLSGLLGAHEPGDRVTLSVLRDSKTLRVPVTLGTLPATE